MNCRAAAGKRVISVQLEPKSLAAGLEENLKNRRGLDVMSLYSIAGGRGRKEFALVR